nr:hypothetical protein Iba_chr12eCG16090 [Ipomoea batatas]
MGNVTTWWRIKKQYSVPFGDMPTANYQLPLITTPYHVINEQGAAALAASIQDCSV